MKGRADLKFIHLSDLHLGRRFYEISLIPEQRYILEQILGIIREEKPGCVVIAGDVYDKSLPPAEAVTLFDDFLSGLHREGVPVLMINGNHDSAERLAFGSEIFEHAGVYISPAYSGEIKPVTFEDEYGQTDFYLLPFLRAYQTREFFPGQTLETDADAAAAAISAIKPDPNRRAVLAAHQFVGSAALRSESEEVTVGGFHPMDPAVFEAFDYVALGHLHIPQFVTERIRYCGTPLKYSFSETAKEVIGREARGRKKDFQKSVTVVELREKGNLQTRQIPLKPMLDLRDLEGKFEDIYALPETDDYLRVTLDDEEPVYDALARLRVKFPNLTRLRYANDHTPEIETGLPAFEPEELEHKEPGEIFGEFFRLRAGREMNAEETACITRLIEKIRDGEP